MAKPEKNRRPRDDEEEAPRKSKRGGERRTVKSARDRAEKRALEGGSSMLNLPEGTKFLKIKEECTKTLTIVPYEAKMDSPYAKKGEIVTERTYFVHRNVGPDESRYICARKTFGKACPICDYRAKLAKKSGTDEETLKSLEPQERQLFRVIDKKKPEDGIQILDMSYYCFGKLLDARVRSDGEDGEKMGWENYGSLDTDGFDLRVTFEEKSMGKGSGTFIAAYSIDFISRKKALDDALIDEGPNLDKILKCEEYETLKDIFLGKGDDDDADDTPSKPAKKPKKSSEDDDEDDEEEEEAPAKKSKKSSDEDEDEEDDDWDDEDEEEPAPKKKSKK